jgi:hypothetical protein
MNWPTRQIVQRIFLPRLRAIVFMECRALQLAHAYKAPAAGTLVYDGDGEVDRLMEDAVALLKAQGVRVGGVLQHFGDRLPSGKRSMWIDNASTGSSFRLDRPRGPGATACVLDPDALTRAACVVQRAIEGDNDLIVVNRFGNAEAEGRGLRAELADALCAGIPVLAAVRYSLLPDWEGFLGIPPDIILPRLDAIMDWFHATAADHSIPGA